MENNNFNPMAYHRNAWVEFTTLTFQEREKLTEIEHYIASRKILKNFKPSRRKGSIMCIETGKIYKNLTECAKEMQRSTSSIFYALTRNSAVYRKYHFKYI